MLVGGDHLTTSAREAGVTEMIEGGPGGAMGGVTARSTRSALDGAIRFVAASPFHVVAATTNVPSAKQAAAHRQGRNVPPHLFTWYALMSTSETRDPVAPRSEPVGHPEVCAPRT
jgi:hypothetical protein